MGNILDQLEKTAQKALKSQSVEEGVKYLAQAFSLFSQESHHLKKAYDGLNERFDAINRELETNHKLLEEKVKKLDFISGYLNNLLMNIQQGIIFINVEGVISTFNREAQRILERKDLENKKFWNHFPNDYFGFSVSDSLKYGLSYGLSFMRLKNLKEIEIATKFVFSEEKKHQGIIILLRDITEIENLKKQKNRQNRINELGQMAATVAHEIKNPLGAIRGYASLLEKDLENTPALKEKAGYILEASKTLERVVNSILQFSRPLQLRKKPHDLCLLIKELIKSIKVDTSFSDEVEISVHLPQNSLFASIDIDLIRLCFLNIISNAYQAMEASGRLEISLIQRNEGCVFSFSDQGCGMTPEQMKHIFSPFFTTKEEGNGLGMSEANKIIEAHFGTIEVTSQLGKGSTFSIYLPLKERSL